MNAHWIPDSDESMMKGYLFEQFVVRRFDHGAYKLLKWRSDKQAGTIFAAENSEPDLVIRFTGKKRCHFAVECKYRSNYDDNCTIIFTVNQLKRYQQFSESKRVLVFLILGVSGSPSSPRDLFIIPLKVLLAKSTLNKTDLEQYQKLGSYDALRFDTATMRVV